MAQRKPQQMPQQQQQDGQIIKEEDQWVYESLEQFLMSPVYKGPLYSFFEENCMIFEDTKNINEHHKQVHASYRDIINNMLYILSQDIQVEHQKIQQLAEVGLNIEGRTKIFWSIAIYYHFNEFVRFMVKKNIDLERKALQQMQGGGQQVPQQQLNPNDPGYQEQLQLQQQYERKQQEKYEKEYEKAIKDSLALEELRKQNSGQNNEQQQMQELEAAIALSKLEHDEQEKKRQLSEEEELQKVLQLSKEQQSQEQAQAFQQIQSNVKEPEGGKKPLSKLEELKQRKAELEKQKEEQKRQEDEANLDEADGEAGGGELLNLSDNDDGATLLEQSQALGQQEFDDMIFSNRQALLDNLNKIDSSAQEQPQQQQQQVSQPQEQETLEQKKERLKKQRELLLAKKKKEREDEAKEYTGEAQSPEKNQVDQKELDHRKQLYQKINTNLEQN